MTIDALPAVPPRGAAGFSAAVHALFAALPGFREQANALAAGMSLLTAGTAASVPMNFSTATADADPGAGLIRLNQAVQNTATMAYIDLASATAADITAYLDALDDSTSTVKGHLRLQSAADATKFLIFAVGAVTAVAGYRKVALTFVIGSAASPFADGAALLLAFTRTGDKGTVGDAQQVDVQNFGASGTYTKPTGNGGAPAKLVLVRALGGAGSGGAGANAAAGAHRGGGSAGGGGLLLERWIAASAIGATESVTIGAGGALAAGGAGAGAAGNAGGSTTFGSLLTAYGGGAGLGGQTSATLTRGGGGAGSAGAGGAGATSDVSGGGPFYQADNTGGTTNKANVFGEAGAGSGAGLVGCSEYGGAGGGAAGSSAANVLAGGGALMGGRGGGAGAGYMASNVNIPATAGGGIGYTPGGGGAAGASGGAPTAGTAGAAPSGLQLAGTAGGGGGANSAGAGAAGGAGGRGCGGGGGGAGTGSAGGNSGPGGDGYCQVITFF